MKTILVPAFRKAVIPSPLSTTGNLTNLSIKSNSHNLAQAKKTPSSLLKVEGFNSSASSHSSQELRPDNWGPQCDLSPSDKSFMDNHQTLSPNTYIDSGATNTGSTETPSTIIAPVVLPNSNNI
ncbi:hypothetical protein CROQUDRAFT_98597 [Cronartium quercuum f. sp. fusiforme G11]|uniref:Uncharacterized protein n=1 Tax=Cronartium quercuum f. sp. fusiforme G11 TaxID=708437 RepID=A0A9P6N9N6_9BASI|nr:hypothetical protein CROQUDRAFT_98597 [Cronartium quercuum f. sp. fusiforme G11]